jgi:hypothetical protein
VGDITRRKQQNRGSCWIDGRTIEYVFLCRTDEGTVGLDVVEAARLIAEVLPLILNDGEAVPHGPASSCSRGEKMAPPCAPVVGRIVRVPPAGSRGAAPGPREGTATDGSSRKFGMPYRT